MAAEANFLVALGLSAYTEIIGGLVTGNLRNPGSGKKNYEAFLSYMGSHYVTLQDTIDLYTGVRCGLVHEYFVKNTAATTVAMLGQGRGIQYDSNVDHIVFICHAYYTDWKKGVAAYLADLEKKVNLQGCFKNALGIQHDSNLT